MQSLPCWFPLGAVAALHLVGLGRDAGATPPDYATFGRPQTADYEPCAREIARIWMLYVGQGDALLIQMPTRFNYDPDGDGELDERVDILIDGGLVNASRPEARLRRHVKKLYPDGGIIEYLVITHHDRDHVNGLRALLKDPAIGVETIYHNGLASYRPTADRLNGVVLDSESAVFVKDDGEIVRVMGLLDEQERFRDPFLIKSYSELRQAFDLDELHRVYRKLARAVLEKDEPFPVARFVRVTEESDFIMEQEAELDEGLERPLVQIDALWPRDLPRRYGDWGESINGNSVTFRFAYGAFAMLFTGDHNDISGEALLEHVGAESEDLDCDLLKVPHHGSPHFSGELIDSLSPVLSVASQGLSGFFNMHHPSPDLIRRLGGSHRVYNTYVHETRFDYGDLPERSDREPLVEEKHVLIETDGRFFRLVEVELDAFPDVPTVQETRRSNGTRWISAVEVE